MINRKQKIEELIENLHSLKRAMVFGASGDMNIPRITPSQWGVLMFIEQRDGTTVKDIANALEITSSAATQLVDGLVVSRYVARKTSENDRRTVILTLSKNTKTQVDKMKKKALEKFLNFFEVLNDQEFDQYVMLNKKIVEKIFKNPPRFNGRLRDMISQNQIC
jgi:DNA-binding MarR family transcriptional regulator